MTKRFLLILGTIILGIWFVGFMIFANKINHYRTDNDTKTDAIVVLTGGRNRISEAVKIWDKGLAEQLFISGVQKNTSLDAISKRQAVNFSKRQGILLDKKSTNTIENAIETQAWIKQNNILSIRLVTSNYHIPRSVEEFHFRNPDLKIIIHPVYSDYVAKDWWKSARSFYLIASEYNKFLCIYAMRRILKKDFN